MQKIITDVVIIGGGIHGCSSALQLAKQGLKVAVIERHHPGRHASGVNAGGVRQLGRHYAELPLTVKSMAMWHHMEDLVGDDCGFVNSGQLKVAENADDLAQLKQRVAHLQGLGYHHEQLISQAQLKELAPAISDHCCGAIYAAQDGHAKPFRTTQAFYRAAQRAGVEFYCDTEVTKVEQSNDVWFVDTHTSQVQAEILINAAGAWSNEIASQLGERVPLQGAALMLMITERLKPFVKPVVSAANRTLSFKQFTNGTVLIGGGLKGKLAMERFKAFPDLQGLATNAKTAREIFPLINNVRVVRSWAGIEAYMPDGIPVISPSATHSNAFHVFGFSSAGFQLGPVTGAILTDLVVRGKTDMPINAFRIDRFN